jgi:multidrug efflux pump subunit AcrA (membrane-fusion protein)
VLGDEVAIGSNSTGVITKIAPALDPVTHKVEIRVGLRGDRSELTNGESVNMTINRKGEVKQASNVVHVPLSALKITPTGAVVFTVSASNTLVAHPVEKGSLLGDQIVLTKGVSPEMEIVIDARGLQDGMSVNITK